VKKVVEQLALVEKELPRRFKLTVDRACAVKAAP
jgi:hypothetical protein